jgi:hypothetical protein
LRRRAAALALAVTICLPAGCSSGSPDGRNSGPPATKAGSSAESSPKKRPRTKPRMFVANKALSERDRVRIRRAVKELKRLGFWKDLTRHLWQVRVSSRPGAQRIPPDGHLADSVYQLHRVRGTHLEPVCDIFFYSRALKLDVERQAEAEAAGALTEPAPGLGQFWAVVLAHELAHCTTRGQKGEAYSTRWEDRVLDAYGAGRLGG